MRIKPSKYRASSPPIRYRSKNWKSPMRLTAKMCSKRRKRNQIMSQIKRRKSNKPNNKHNERLLRLSKRTLPSLRTTPSNKMRK